MFRVSIITLEQRPFGLCSSVILLTFRMFSPDGNPIPSQQKHVESQSNNVRAMVECCSNVVLLTLNRFPPAFADFGHVFPMGIKLHYSQVPNNRHSPHPLVDFFHPGNSYSSPLLPIINFEKMSNYFSQKNSHTYLYIVLVCNISMPKFPPPCIIPTPYYLYMPKFPPPLIIQAPLFIRNLRVHI